MVVKTSFGIEEIASSASFWETDDYTTLNEWADKVKQFLKEQGLEEPVVIKLRPHRDPLSTKLKYPNPTIDVQFVLTPSTNQAKLNYRRELTNLNLNFDGLREYYLSINDMSKEIPGRDVNVDLDYYDIRNGTQRDFPSIGVYGGFNPEQFIGVYRMIVSADDGIRYFARSYDSILS